MIYLYNENGQIDIINPKYRLTEETASSFCKFLKDKGIADITSTTLNAFYVKAVTERAERFAKRSKQKFGNGRPMEDFLNKDGNSITEGQFKKETVDAIVKDFNIPLNIATNIVDLYLEKIHSHL